MSITNRFSNIGFEEFRRFAKEKGLSKYERIGFPDEYRKDFEETIFIDIRSKLTNLDNKNLKIVDIGPGCSDLPIMLINLCCENNHQLTMIDSEEMLSLLPNYPFINKVPSLFPNCPEWLESNQKAIDVILCYSIFHYVFLDTAFFRFLDCALSLLSPGGQMLIGDIPNISKRKRFFSSESGIRFHKEFMKTANEPQVVFNNIEYDQIDDAVIFSLLQRARMQGFDAYVLPQGKKLPMANRREDILITRP